MKHQLQTIRTLFHGLDMDNGLTEGGDVRALDIYEALSELERMAGEPFGHYVYFPDQQCGEFAHDLDELCEDMTNDENHQVTALYTAAPPAQQPQRCPLCNYQYGHQIGCENNPVDIAIEARAAQQPQARPDFTDEWTGYLKDGETPFERFLRERKDLGALTKLYQRALEENERLKAQQPQQPQQPQAECRSDGRCQYAIDHGAEGLGHCPEGKCAMKQPQAEMVQQKPKLIGWRTSDYLMETADKDKAANWEVHHEMLPIFEGDPYTKLVAAPQQAEAVQWREAIKNLADQYASECVEFAEALKSGAGSMSPMAARAGDTRLALHNAIDCASPAPQQAEAVPSDVVLDAERYRFLRDRNNSLETRQHDKGITYGQACYHDVEGIRELKHGEELDAAIDAAMAQGEKP